MYICHPEKMYMPLTCTAIYREVPEWLKGLAWKAGIRETVSRVRIPSSLLLCSKYFQRIVGSNAIYFFQ